MIFELRHIRFFFLSILHVFAMNCPGNHFKYFFYSLRGTKIGRNVDIASMVFLEEVYPELITINDNADIGPGVIIVTHDSSGRCVFPGTPVYKKEVIIGTNVFIGAGATILPGVTIGDNSVVGAGAVVTEDIAQGSIVAGIPARIISTIDKWEEKRAEK